MDTANLSFAHIAITIFGSMAFAGVQRLAIQRGAVEFPETQTAGIAPGDKPARGAARLNEIVGEHL